MYLTQAEIGILAPELNHLLWTDDQPSLPAEISHLQLKVNVPKGNMQCAAHAVICATLLARRGAKVTMRGGSAWALTPNHPQPFFILKHWWITTENGLVDFSVRLFEYDDSPPCIYNNCDVFGRWTVSYSDDLMTINKRLQRAHMLRQRGMFYQTDKKMEAPKAALDEEMPKLFLASEQVCPIAYGAVLNHCENLLSGGESFRRWPQVEAWRMLRFRYSRWNIAPPIQMSYANRSPQP